MDGATDQAITAWSAPEPPPRRRDLRRPVRHSKLDQEKRRKLCEELRRRRHLLQELAQLSMKVLAAKYGLYYQAVWRLDDAIHGCHIPDPIQRRRVEPCAVSLNPAE